MSDAWGGEGGNQRWLLLAAGITLSLVLVVIGLIIIAKSGSGPRAPRGVVRNGLIEDTVVAPTALPPGTPTPEIVDDSNALPENTNKEMKPAAAARGWPNALGGVGGDDTAAPTGASVDAAVSGAAGQGTSGAAGTASPGATGTATATGTTVTGSTSGSSTPQGWPTTVLVGSGQAGTTTGSSTPSAWPWPLPATPVDTSTIQTPVGAITTWRVASGAASTVTPATGSVTSTKRLSSITYGTDPLQVMDVYWREGVKNAPVIYLVHGGSNDVGDKSRMRDRALMYQEWGAVVVVPNYRYGAGDVGHPLAGNDVACGLATTARKVSAAGGDPNKLIVHGFSYGGHIASFVLYDQSYPWLRGCAVGSLSGIVRGFIGESSNYGDPMPKSVRDAAISTADPARRAELLTPFDIYADNARVMDGAINYLDVNDPPAILLHGKKDPTYDDARAADFSEALKNVKADVSLMLSDTQGHGMDIPATPSLEASLRSTIDSLFMGSR